MLQVSTYKLPSLYNDQGVDFSTFGNSEDSLKASPQRQHVSWEAVLMECDDEYDVNPTTKEQVRRHT